jgi:hypothetical protein
VLPPPEFPEEDPPQPASRTTANTQARRIGMG